MFYINKLKRVKYLIMKLVNKVLHTYILNDNIKAFIESLIIPC